MARTSIQLLFMAAVILIGPNSTVVAANVQNSNDKLCAFSLDGPITSGDSDRLSAAISGGRIDQYDERC
jgi:hypothetical protein